MYKRHNNWDEDKLDMHKGAGYVGHSDSTQEYHKNEVYASGEGSTGNDYMSHSKEEEDKDKDKDEHERNIVDAVEEEGKKQEEELEQDIFPKMNTQEMHQQSNEKEEKPQKKNKSIEEAINKAIKKEKETIYLG